ncbi:MAG: cation:proton antiporter [Alphaproteobacteria bacterium]|jgi:CPA2 family monovalent cation:H+ antiporter-2|nr:cation:proton antiporter [Alphaproteobacteria bacterium]
MHASALLDIALVVTAALLAGLLLQRLRQPAIVGYILAGAVLGPSGLELIADRETVGVLAELGVLLLLFTIGMELSLRGFRRVYRIALLGCGLQIGLAIFVMLLLSKVFGWPTPLAVLLGFVGALSSTAVAFKLLEDIGELRSEIGRTAVGVLIAQDLAVVPMLLVVDGMAGGEGLGWQAALKVLVAVALLAIMIAYLSRRERVGLPFMAAIGDNVELTAIVALAYCFGGALISALVGLSPAYGAFLAGLWIGNSHGRAPVLAAALPIQSVLLMVFFLSIGMLLDAGYIWANLTPVLVLLIVVTVFKSAANIAILRIVGEPWSRAWLAGMVLGQLGEFSFLLLAAGTAVGLLAAEHEKLITSLIALSLMSSPLWLLTERRLQRLAAGGISGFRQVLAQLYRKETRAIVVVSRYVATGAGDVARHSLKLGEDGKDLYHRLRGRGGGQPAEPEDTSGDAAFDDDGAGPTTAEPAEEAPKRIAPDA